MSECHNLIISHTIIMNFIMSISINKHVLEPDDSLYYSYMVAVSTFAWPCLNWGDAWIQGIVIEARSYCYGMFVKEHSEGVPQIGLVTCDEMVFQLRDEYFGETCLVSLLIARTTFRINTSQWCCPHFSCQCCISGTKFWGMLSCGCTETGRRLPLSNQARWRPLGPGVWVLNVSIPGTGRWILPSLPLIALSHFLRMRTCRQAINQSFSAARIICKSKTQTRNCTVAI